MANLNPTLWRTCKMLAGQTRIRLLRQLHRQPGPCVADLGKAVGIKRSDASQELRRIQSRGLLKSMRQGIPLVYRMEPDPQVASAAPLLKAIRASLSAHPPERDSEIGSIANGLAHERRIAIVRSLQNGPQPVAALPTLCPGSRTSIQHHLRTLENSGWILVRNGTVSIVVPSHPLAHALVKLL